MLISVRVALCLVCTALAASGCSGQKDNSSFPSVVTTLGEQSPSPLPKPSSSPSSSAKPSPKPSSPASYPSGARAYAEAVIAAWKAHNLTRLGELTTSQVQEQLMEIPGPPNMAWTYQMCDGAAGSSYCHFKNADGHKLILRITSELLGKPDAAVQVIYEML